MPMAVFVNLAVYVVYSEIGSSPVAGGLALMAVAVLAVQGRIGLMGSTLLAAAIHYLLARAAQNQRSLRLRPRVNDGRIRPTSNPAPAMLPP